MKPAKTKVKHFTRIIESNKNGAIKAEDDSAMPHICFGLSGPTWLQAPVKHVFLTKTELFTIGIKNRCSCVTYSGFGYDFFGASYPMKN